MPFGANSDEYALLHEDIVDGAADGLAPEESLGVYRNNVFASLTAVLRETFPAVCRLVDERFFAYAAHEFICRHPPECAVLAEYGRRFPDFLAAFAPCRELVYLAAVAQIYFPTGSSVVVEQDQWDTAVAAFAGGTGIGVGIAGFPQPIDLTQGRASTHDWMAASIAFPHPTEGRRSRVAGAPFGLDAREAILV